MIKRLLVAGMLALTSVLCGGCLFGSHTHETQSGSFVQPATFDQVKPGVTAGFVEATLGVPDSKTAVKDDGSEIWRWGYTEKKSSSGYVFLLFGGSDERESKHAAYVQVQNGVVVKAWRG